MARDISGDFVGAGEAQKSCVYDAFRRLASLMTQHEIKDFFNRRRAEDGAEHVTERLGSLENYQGRTENPRPQADW